MSSENFHENFGRTEKVKVGSDQKFGFTISAVLFLYQALKFFKHHHFYKVLFIISSLFLVASLLKPSFLHKLNIGWMYIGHLLKKITNPIALGFLFFFIIAPIGLLLKLFKKDILHLKIKKDQKSYWVINESPVQLENQF